VNLGYYQNGRPRIKIPFGRPFCPDIHERLRLSRGRDFTCGRSLSVRVDGKNGSAHLSGCTSESVRARVPAGLGPCVSMRAQARARTDTSPRKCGEVSTWTCGSVRVDAVLEGWRVKVLCMKGGALPFSLISNQFQLNSWGFEWCIHTSFFSSQIFGFLVESPLQTGGGREVFFILQVF
jgi:hypothetical protein